MKAFRLEPATKDYLWGGTKLKENYNKKAASEVVAETWELSAHPEGPSVIASGEKRGMTFEEYILRWPEAMGEKAAGHTEFPLLIKLIDAKQDLSVQVHPDDDYARRVENSQGKTEMWIVLEHEPEAFLYCGFCEEPTRKELQQRIANGTLDSILQKVPVEKGDVVFIPAGTIHAIGAGIVLAEIQQNSNTTYRVFDYNRTDKNGNLRPLHVEKALDVIDRRAGVAPPPGSQPLEETAGYDLACLAEYRLFTVRDLRMRAGYQGCVDDSSFLSLLCVEGFGVLKSEEGELPFGKGDSVFLPAGAGQYGLEGAAHLIMTTL